MFTVRTAIMFVAKDDTILHGGGLQIRELSQSTLPHLPNSYAIPVISPKSIELLIFPFANLAPPLTCQKSPTSIKEILTLPPPNCRCLL